MYCNQLLSGLSIATRRMTRLPAAFIMGLQLILFASAAAASLSPDTQPDRAVSVAVKTAEGPIRGYVRDGINNFLGIPYAAPPVGDLRWRPPQAVKRWTRPLDATHFANTCPQVSTLGTFSLPRSVNEDCLYLNVFAKSIGKADKKKPVIVWIHGGGNMTGASDDYDVRKLTTGGPEGVETVVVTFNYRLNLFGAFSHPALNAKGEPWGNYGILDQQAVLRWVQRNISAFGGDPDRVTVGGESAGAYDTGAHVLSPLSKGLFSRAIFMSSPGFTYVLPTAEGTTALGMTFAEAVGCPGTDSKTAQCLRNLPSARILQFAGTHASFSPYAEIMPFVDGTVIPMQPEDAWKSGSFNKTPIMGGGTRDEYAFFTGVAEYYSGWPQKPMGVSEYEAAVSPGAYCLFCKDFKMPQDVATQYSLSQNGDRPMEAFQRLNTDVARCRELHVLQKWAPQVPVYAYDFTYPNAPFYFPKMPGFRAGAAHTIDLQFVFDGFHGSPLGVNLDQSAGLPRELNAAESKLSDQMVAAWTHFADTGNPNAGKGEGPWVRFSSGSTGTFLVQDIPLTTKRVSEFRKDYQCDYWDKQLPLPD